MSSEVETSRCIAVGNAAGSSTSLGMTVILIFGFAGAVFGLTPGDLSRVTMEQHPGLQLSHDLIFRDENGQQFRFGNSATKQPTVLVPGYYRCPMLCPLINDGLIQALQDLRANVGRDFQVVDFSIDPADTPADAHEKNPNTYGATAGRVRRKAGIALWGINDRLRNWPMKSDTGTPTIQKHNSMRIRAA